MKPYSSVTTLVAEETPYQSSNSQSILEQTVPPGSSGTVTLWRAIVDWKDKRSPMSHFDGY